MCLLHKWIYINSVIYIYIFHLPHVVFFQTLTFISGLDLLVFNFSLKQFHSYVSYLYFLMFIFKS